MLNRTSGDWKDSVYPEATKGPIATRARPSQGNVEANCSWLSTVKTIVHYQAQAMLQVLLNILEFGMDSRLAVEMSQFSNYSFPGSFYPYDYKPSVVRIEDWVSEEIVGALKTLATRWIVGLHVRGERVLLHRGSSFTKRSLAICCGQPARSCGRRVVRAARDAEDFFAHCGHGTLEQQL